MKKKLLFLMALLVSSTMAWAWSGYGTSSEPYLIQSASDWNTLATNVNNGTTYSGVYFKQTANITVSNIVGSYTSKAFSGTYDGDGHTITADINSTSTSGAALFAYINGATIKNFTVTGEVKGGIHCSAVVGGAAGENTISNIKATAAVTCSSTHCGGILGHGLTSATTLEGCVFAGSISATGYVGALWGWSDSGCAPTIKDCLEACTSYTTTNFNPVGMCSSWGTVTNTYYNNAVSGNTTHARHNSRGKQAYTITAGDGVTINGLGTATDTYDVSAITAYATGIKYNDVYFAGSGDAVSLTLSGSSTGNYKTTTSTLSGAGNPFTLTMAAANTVVDEDPWLYVAEGNVLKAYGVGGYTADSPLTLTLTAPSNLLFDGAYKSATLSGSDAWTAAGLTLPTIYYDGITASPSLLGSHTATITAGGQTATLDFEITADVTYKSFFDFTRGILEGTNYDVVSGTGSTVVGLNNGSAGVWWDSTNKYAVFDGQAYLQIDNPLGNVDATTGFTIAIDVYISSDNNSSGSYYRTTGVTSSKRGYQRLFDLSDGTTKNYYCLNAGSARHMGCARRYNGGSSLWLTNSSGKTYYNQWLTYTLVVFPGGYTTIYVDGTPIATESPNTTATDVVNNLSTYNYCYMGTSIWEALGSNSDAFFIGKIRGYQTAEGALLPYYNGSSYQYLLTYKTNGGNAINAAFATALPSSLPTPTRTGFTFSGWYTNEALTTPAVAGAAMTENTFLYAKWVEDYEEVATNVDPENPGVYYYSTFYHSTQKYALTNDGTVAFVADLSGSDLVLTEIAEGTDVIPANTAVIFRKTGSDEPVALTPTDAEPVSVTANNDLEGVDAETAVTAIDGLTTANCYVLSGTNEYGVGFYRINSDNLKAHKAYVKYSGTQNNAPRRMRFVFEQENTTTGVENTNADADAVKVLRNGQLIIIRNGVEYNVNGQMVK